MSKSSNESGASDSSIDAGVASVASAAKASAVVEAAATRATKAAIAPVLPVFVADADASAADVASASASDAAAAAGAADQRPEVDVDVLDNGAVAAGVVEAEPVALTDGVPTVRLAAAADERPAEDAAGAARAIADALPGRVGRGGGFAAGGGDAAGAGRAGGTVGTAAFETGLLTVATRGVTLGPATDDAGRLTPAAEPAVAPEGSWGAEADCDADAGDWAPEGAMCTVDEPECAVAEPVSAVDEADCPASDLAADEVAAEDSALPALEAAAVRTLEVVVELGRVAVPAWADPAGARAAAPGCAEVVDAPVSLAARSLAAPAASPTREPESVTPLSAAREAEAAAEVDGALADVLGDPPTPGIPKPAGDVGFPATPGVWTAAAADEGAEVGAEVELGAEVDGCDRAFTDGAALAAIDAGDIALGGVGADAPPPAEAESASTGPAGSNN